MRVSTNESCLISCDIALMSSKYNHRCVFPIINNGHTLVTQDHSMTVGGTSLSFSGQVTKRVFLLGWKQLKLFYGGNMITDRYFVNCFKDIDWGNE